MHVLSCFVSLKSVLLISCVFSIFLFLFRTLAANAVLQTLLLTNVICLCKIKISVTDGRTLGDLVTELSDIRIVLGLSSINSFPFGLHTFSMERSTCSLLLYTLIKARTGQRVSLMYGTYLESGHFLFRHTRKMVISLSIILGKWLFSFQSHQESGFFPPSPHHIEKDYFLFRHIAFLVPFCLWARFLCTYFRFYLN